MDVDLSSVGLPRVESGTVANEEFQGADEEDPGHVLPARPSPLQAVAGSRSGQDVYVARNLRRWSVRISG